MCVFFVFLCSPVLCLHLHNFLPKLKEHNTRLQLKVAEGDDSEELGNGLGKE